jgi:dTDP-4-dehydrorhamnose 3,5-epimerase-like enzyme
MFVLKIKNLAREIGQNMPFTVEPQESFEKEIGPVHVVQENESFSTYQVLRGLHFQNIFIIIKFERIIDICGAFLIKNQVSKLRR